MRSRRRDRHRSHALYHGRPAGCRAVHSRCYAESSQHSSHICRPPGRRSTRQDRRPDCLPVLLTTAGTNRQAALLSDPAQGARPGQAQRRPPWLGTNTRHGGPLGRDGPGYPPPAARSTSRAWVVGPPGRRYSHAASTGLSSAGAQVAAIAMMSSSDTHAARTRTGSGSVSSRTNATPAPVTGSQEIRSAVAGAVAEHHDHLLGLVCRHAELERDCQHRGHPLHRSARPGRGTVGRWRARAGGERDHE